MIPLPMAWDWATTLDFVLLLSLTDVDLVWSCLLLSFPAIGLVAKLVLCFFADVFGRLGF